MASDSSPTRYRHKKPPEPIGLRLNMHQYAAIGRIAAEWALIEHHIDRTISGRCCPRTRRLHYGASSVGQSSYAEPHLPVGLRFGTGQPTKQITKRLKKRTAELAGASARKLLFLQAANHRRTNS
jgi:hypothetical protein